MNEKIKKIAIWITMLFMGTQGIVGMVEIPLQAQSTNQVAESEIKDDEAKLTKQEIELASQYLPKTLNSSMGVVDNKPKDFLTAEESDDAFVVLFGDEDNNYDTIVKLLANSDGKSLATSLGGAVIKKDSMDETDEQFIERISQIKGVKNVAKNTKTEMISAAIPNDEFYGKQWEMHQMGMEKAWDISRGKGVKIGVMDTGFLGVYGDTKSEEFDMSRILPLVSKAKDNTCYANGAHAALVISILGGAKTNNKTGMASIANEATIQPYMSGYNCKKGSPMVSKDGIAVMAIFDHALATKVDIMNMSYISRDGAFENKIFSKANRMGMLIVGSRGNDAKEEATRVYYPACSEGTVAVGAINKANSKTDFSNYGDCGSEYYMMAYGENVQTAYMMPAPISKIIVRSTNGTSFSAPIVSGVLALMKAARPSATSEELKSILALTATDIGEKGYDQETGHGGINPLKALEVTLEGVTEKLTVQSPKMSLSIAEAEVITDEILIKKAGVKASKNDGTASDILVNQKIKAAVGRYFVKFKTPKGISETVIVDVDNEHVLRDEKLGWALHAKDMSISKSEAASGILGKILSQRGEMKSWELYDGSEGEYHLDYDIIPVFGKYPVKISARSGLEKTIIVTVEDTPTEINEESNTGMHAIDFSLTTLEAKAITQADIITKAQARVWSLHDQKPMDFTIAHGIKQDLGVYTVKFTAATGLEKIVRAKVIRAQENTTIDESKDTAISAAKFNIKLNDESFFGNIDEMITEKAKAKGWKLSNNEALKLTVTHNIERKSGIYPVTFTTETNVQRTILVYIEAQHTLEYPQNDEIIGAASFQISQTELKTATYETLKLKAQVQARKLSDDSLVEVIVESFDQNKTPGAYQITFTTAKGSKVGVTVSVVDDRTVINNQENTGLFANNITINAFEAIKLTPELLKEKMGAKAWALDNGASIELKTTGHVAPKQGVYPISFTTAKNVSILAEVKVEVEPNTIIDNQNKTIIRANNIKLAENEVKELTPEALILKAEAKAVKTEDGTELTLKVTSIITEDPGVYEVKFTAEETGASKTILAQVTNKQTIINEQLDTGISANDFIIQATEVATITKEQLITRAKARGFTLSKIEELALAVEHKIAPNVGSYEVKFTTSTGLSKVVSVSVEGDSNIVRVGDMIYYLFEDKTIDRAEQFVQEAKVALYYYLPGTNINDITGKLQYKFNLSGDGREHITQLDEYNRAKQRISISYFTAETTYANWGKNISEKYLLSADGLEYIVRLEQYNTNGKRVTISEYQPNTKFASQSGKISAKYILTSDGSQYITQLDEYNTKQQRIKITHFFSHTSYEQKAGKRNFEYILSADGRETITRLDEYSTAGKRVTISEYQPNTKFVSRAGKITAKYILTSDGSQYIMQLDEYNTKQQRIKITHFFSHTKYEQKAGKRNFEYILSADGRENITRLDQYNTAGKRVVISEYQPNTKFASRFGKTKLRYNLTSDGRENITQLEEYNTKQQRIKITHFFSHTRYEQRAGRINFIYTLTPDGKDYIVGQEVYNTRGHKISVIEYQPNTKFSSRLGRIKYQYMLSNDGRQDIMRRDEYNSRGKRINYALFRSNTKYGNNHLGRIIKVVRV
ncbi:MAG: S8 family peptidase [Culicoidibacterales bacterium]